MAGLVLGLILFGVGLFSVIWPQEVVMIHATNGPIGERRPGVFESVTRRGARVYGIAAMLFGSAIAGYSVFPRKT